MQNPLHARPFTGLEQGIGAGDMHGPAVIAQTVLQHADAIDHGPHARQTRCPVIGPVAAKIAGDPFRAGQTLLGRLRIARCGHHLMPPGHQMRDDV